MWKNSCEGIAVLNFGRIIAKGSPDDIQNNPEVIEAYYAPICKFSSTVICWKMWRPSGTCARPCSTILCGSDRRHALRRRAADARDGPRAHEQAQASHARRAVHGSRAHSGRADPSDIIRELHAAGTTILLVEQNAQAALSVADRAYVLETGKISLTGTGAELMASDAVRKAYLGG